MRREEYQAIRDRTVALVDGLSAEDCQVQSMPDASPAKWHLAHTSWLFETFVLRPHAPDYRVFDERFDYLFNSYYYAHGPMHERSSRGLLTRPALARVLEYRAWVDDAMAALLAADPSVAALAELGLNHEQQHQELLLSDLKHAFAQNPLRPAYRESFDEAPALAAGPGFRAHAGGEVAVGAGEGGFAYDNERPRHPVLLQPFAIATRPVTNAEYAEFVRDGGYDGPGPWLADGWAAAQAGGWRRPLYWHDDLAHAFTLAGVRPLHPDAPVCHLSHYEADAFARWAGARLPTEFEWEAARPADAGLVWEWTASAYLPYPGFKPYGGGLGEYNGKFMSGQMVLRGGSFATAPGHCRPSYRNFFPPGARWQFAGLRLAR